MDLINQLATQLDLDTTQAKGLAGTLLGKVGEAAGPEAAQAIGQSVPELDQWSQAAANPEPEQVGLLGGFLGGGGSALIGSVMGEGAQETAEIASMLSKLGIEPTKALMAAPLIKQFIEERLPEEWSGRIVDAASALLGAKDEPKEPQPEGLKGAIGSLFS
jgi:hypothetical protein